MSKINLLDSSIFNRIAAGEVIENPRSIVKELVENSIDAGADMISVEIRNGGIDYICVSDNGKGIDKDDMPLAFMPHATSKISSVKDLENITTLGFRGEALASIASVTDVEVSSRTPESELGYRIVLSDGKVVDQGECGIPFGTIVTTRNLFANVPARAKFLRKPKAEESSVTEYIIKIILANPTLHFKYTADGELLYKSDGSGIESAVYNVYGAEFYDKMAPISYTMPDISLSGMICRPDYSKHNRTYQTLIVNGRYIVNADISYCIQQAYQNYLMKRQFPAYILYLNLPVDMVDVNVHPNKMDVRFANEKRIKSVIYNAVKAKVDELAVMPTQYASVGSQMSANKQNDTQSDSATDSNVKIGSFRISAFGDNSPHTPAHATHTPKAETKIGETSSIRSTIGNFFTAAFEDNVSNSENTVQENSSVDLDLLFAGVERPRYIGKLFNTYLFVESGNYFYIIDQHAAHEKILYDKLVEQVGREGTAIQDLLIPYIFDVSPSEKVALTDNLKDINALGFKIDPLSGNSFSLYAVPMICADMDFKRFVSLLLDGFDYKKSQTEFIKEKLMQAACKSAIKGEDDLSQSEIDALLDQMRKSESTKFCPHGRPTVIKFSKYDLEKLFKRAL